MSAPLRIAGYAALFNAPDGARDTIRPGAFAATLAALRGARAGLPLHWQHRPGQRIGRVVRAHEDARGLAVVAEVEPASRAAALLRARAVSGLSFGYRVRRAARSPHGRVLLAVDLIEVSVVTHPLQHGARVHWSSASAPVRAWPSQARLASDRAWPSTSSG